MTSRFDKTALSPLLVYRGQYFLVLQIFAEFLIWTTEHCSSTDVLAYQSGS